MDAGEKNEWLYTSGQEKMNEEFEEILAKRAMMNGKWQMVALNSMGEDMTDGASSIWWTLVIDVKIILC